MRRVLVFGFVAAFGCRGDSDGMGEEGQATSSASASGSDATTGETDHGDDSTNGDPTGATHTGADSTGADSAGSDSTGSEDTGGGDQGPDVDRSDPQLYEFALDPRELDPDVEDSIEIQYAQLDTRAEPIGKLVFFLSGFTNTPAAWRNHGRHLASYGFHVVIPHYDNRWSCSGGPPNCNEDTRWEALTGEDTSSIVAIERRDSAEGRVIAMLLHLVEVHPGGDWGYYLRDDDTLRDEHVIIAGISHGASSSGLFATRRTFHRVVMHAGAWGATGDSPATPIEAFFSLSHRDDDQHAGHLAAWDAAGLLGVPTVIEDVPPPYGNSRRLVATTPNTYPHCSVAVHSSSPMRDDEYVFDSAWRTMYGAR